MEKKKSLLLSKYWNSPSETHDKQLNRSEFSWQWHLPHWWSWLLKLGVGSEGKETKNKTKHKNTKTRKTQFNNITNIFLFLYHSVRFLLSVSLSPHPLYSLRISSIFSFFKFFYLWSCLWCVYSEICSCTQTNPALVHHRRRTNWETVRQNKSWIM